MLSCPSGVWLVSFVGSYILRMLTYDNDNFQLSPASLARIMNIRVTNISLACGARNCRGALLTKVRYPTELRPGQGEGHIMVSY